MRYITIPPDAVTETGRTLSFVTLVRSVWTIDPKHFGASLATLTKSAALYERFATKKPGDEVEVHDDEWSLLCKAVEEPTTPYMPETLRCAIYMMNIVLHAPKSPRHRAAIGSDELEGSEVS